MGTSQARVRFRLQYKLALGIGLPVALLVSALTAVLAQRGIDLATANAQRQAEALSTMLGAAVVTGYVFHDTTSLQGLLETLKVLPGITYVTLRDDDGTLVAGIGDAVDPKLSLHTDLATGGSEEARTDIRGDVVHVVRSIAKKTGKGGMLRLGYVLTEARVEAQAGTRIAAFLGLAALLAAIIVGAALGSFLARPVAALTRAAQGVAATGDLRQAITVDSRDEVGLLALTFSRMIEAQRSALAALKSSARELSSLSSRLAGTGERVVHGAGTIDEQVQGTATTVRDMTQSLAAVERSVAALRQGAETSHGAVERSGRANDQAKSAVSTMTEAVDRTSSAITEMAASVADTAHNLEALDRAVNETSVAMRSIEDVVTHVQQTAQETATLSDATTEAAGQGATAIESTLRGIEQIRASSAATSDAISALASRIGDVGTIVSVIDQIANQTSLLSLNAAIIAAQAGEHGKGFAVVADEVKNLSDRTRRSTDEIAALIRTIQAASESALEAVRKGALSVVEGAEVGQRASDAFQAIVAKAVESSTKTRVIADATLQQKRSTGLASASVQRIVDTVQQIRKASQEQARGATEIAKSSQEMHELSGRARTAGEQQLVEATAAAAALTSIARTINEVDAAQALLRTEVDHVDTAMRAIATVSQQQSGLAGELEDVIRTLNDLVSQLGESTERYRT